MDTMSPRQSSRTLPLTRRVMMVGGTAFLLTGLQAVDAVARQGTPIAAPATPSDAVNLLNEAATAMTALDSFAFSLVTVEGETVILEGFTLEEIAGVVRRPSDFETTVTVAIPFASLDLRAVSINNQVWIELPSLGEGGGGWTSIGSTEGLLTLLSPDVLILEALPYIENPAIVDTGDIDGVDVTYVSGSVDFRSAAERLGDGADGFSLQIAEGPVELMIAIDDDRLIREIEIIGPLLAGEDASVVRLVTFSGFNEPVEIEEPEV